MRLFLQNSLIVSKVVAIIILCLIGKQWYGIIHRFNTNLNPTAYTVEYIGNHTYEVDLGNHITDGDPQYLKLAKWIRERDRLEKIVFKIHSYGGSVMTESILISAIKATPAKTVGHVIGTTYSAGSGIACATDEVQMDPYTFLMFHQPHKGGQQLPKDMVEAANQNLQECKKHHILNQEIIDRLNNGTTATEYYYYKGKEVYDKPLNPNALAAISALRVLIGYGV